MAEHAKGSTCALDPLDDHGPFRVQLYGVLLVALLLAVLQAGTFVVLQHPMLAAVMARAETTVADDALGGFLAVLEGASYLLGRHAASDGQGEGEGRVCDQVERRDRWVRA